MPDLLPENLLQPLEELSDIVAIKGATNPSLSPKIPIPTTDHIQKIYPTMKEVQGLRKYAKEYERFCEWSALPKDIRDPQTLVAFEKKYKLPKGYTFYFKTREDFREKTLKNFWDNLMDVYPDVVHSVYQRAIAKSDKAAALFLDLMNKHMNLDKPRVSVQPMVLMGVPQEKIDKLFTPQGFAKIEDITPK